MKVVSMIARLAGCGKCDGGKWLNRPSPEMANLIIRKGLAVRWVGNLQRVYGVARGKVIGDGGRLDGA